MTGRGGGNTRQILTMILAVTTNAQATGLDGGKTQPDRLSQSCSIDMGDLILFADPAIRKVEALTRYIAIGIGSIISA